MADTRPKTKLYAGDSSTWTSSFSNYPATTYSAICIFQKHGTAPITLISTASGNDFVFTFESEKSSLLDPGEWNWAIRVKNGTEIVTASAGKTKILPNPERIYQPTFYEKCLKLIQDALEDRLTDLQESITILGQDITKIPAGELHRLQHYYQAQVNKQRKFTEQLITGRRSRRSRIYLKD